MKRFYTFVSLVLMVLCVACSSSKKTQSEGVSENLSEKRQSVVPDTFLLPEVPSSITNAEARTSYLVTHYWDRFDFTNRELIQKAHITEQAFVDYIHVLTYVDQIERDKSLKNTWNKAEADSAMSLHFASLFEKYFYDPNSPFRNEAFYIPVLRDMEKSDMLSPEIRSKYQFQLDMAMKNRVGEKTADFSYTLASGKSSNLYSIKSEYVLLMFSNPDCATCAAVTKALNALPGLNKAFRMNSPSRTMVAVLTVFPDNNADEWFRHIPELPNRWINGYDKDMTITHKRLYDIKAIPTIYLLDKDKKVILKDTSLEAIESFFLNPSM